MADYDIAEAFEQIEQELISSIMRNMKRHKAEEAKEGMRWSMWQTEQLKALEKYKAEQKKYNAQFKSINKQIEDIIQEMFTEGGMAQERAILDAIKKGFFASRGTPGITAEFFKLNERKLEALIDATVSDMQKAETAILRMANDQYRKAIYNAQVYANTGAGTYEKAVDMAVKDMLSAGLNCVEYSNGSRHRLKEYAGMALRTASKRAYLAGEGTKRQEWGIYTVIINKRATACPKCLPFVGKVMIDDVWSAGPKSGISPQTGKKYPLISTAIEAGLYHPNCRDSHTTYFEGISDAPKGFTKAEAKEVAKHEEREIYKRYAKRQAEKYGRLEENSLDNDDKEKYGKKAATWKQQAEVFKISGTKVSDDKSIAKTDSSDIMAAVEKIHRSVGAKAWNYDVYNPATGEIVHLAEGTRILQPKDHVMAGKGRRRQIDCADRLNFKYPEADPEEWTKEKGFGYVLDEYGEQRKVELHWYQNPQTGKVEMKIKMHDGRLYIEDV